MDGGWGGWEGTKERGNACPSTPSSVCLFVFRSRHNFRSLKQKNAENATETLATQAMLRVPNRFCGIRDLGFFKGRDSEF